MAKAIEDPTLLAYAGILLWSQGSVKLNAEPWPDWQRCALRRIVLGGELQAADLDELEWICKAGAGLVPTDGRKVNKAMPLDGKHLPTGTGGAAAVSLVRISGLKGVNRIKGDPPLEFGPSPGLTIIFGANGAGKSGYARVIKKACRARGNIQAIRPNVFDATDQGPAQAKITCTVGAVNTPLQWRDGTPADPRLSNVFVFDSVSARFHVSSDGPATFIPRGLDVLPKLAQACDEIKRRINEDINNENNAILTAKSSLKYTPGTKVAQLIDGLSASTKSETIEALAVLSEAEEERLAELNDALKSDPCQKSARTQAAATRIRGFKTLVTEILRGAGATKAEAIRTALNEAKTAAAAAKAAATPFAKAFLPGTGGEEWRSLWEIARSYSAVAYPGKTFPNVGDDAHCPLCQQEFDHDAVERMKQFDEYVKGEARARARKADGRVAELVEELKAVSALGSEFSRVSADLSETTRKKIETFVKAADERLKHLKKCLTDVSWHAPEDFPESPAAALEASAVAYDKRAQTELSAVDPDERKKMIAERNELADREWLSANVQALLDQIERYGLIALLKKCLKDTTTNTISLRSGDIHDMLVSKALCDKFEAEIKALGPHSLDVKLEIVGANKGERKFGIRLSNAVNAPLAEIASEGEQRCIALAAFLAELSQASHKSALVFDDPVSSLDHNRRASVAKRLCEEALVRQVIIFTHDAVFLEELFDHCAEMKIPNACNYVSWKGNAPGYAEKGLPWDWQGYVERLHHLDEEQRRVAKDWQSVPNPENIAAMARAYDQYRAALEKIVQDCVLAGVVSRYRSWIKVEKLHKIVDFTEAECKEIERLEKKASDNLTGHTKATGKQQQIPTPADLKADIDALKRVVDAAMNRKASKQPAKIGVPAKGASQN